MSLLTLLFLRPPLPHEFTSYCYAAVDFGAYDVVLTAVEVEAEEPERGGSFPVRISLCCCCRRCRR